MLSRRTASSCQTCLARLHEGPARGEPSTVIHPDAHHPGMICLHHTVPVWHQYNLVADDGSAAVLPHQIQIPPPQPQGLPRVSLRLPAHALQSNLQIITSEVRTSESIGPSVARSACLAKPPGGGSRRSTARPEASRLRASPCALAMTGNRAEHEKPRVRPLLLDCQHHRIAAAVAKLRA